MLATDQARRARWKGELRKGEAAHSPGGRSGPLGPKVRDPAQEHGKLPKLGNHGVLGDVTIAYRGIAQFESRTSCEKVAAMTGHREESGAQILGVTARDHQAAGT